jgi:hypothetical protein
MATLPSIPQPLSEPQIISGMLSSFASSTGISSSFVGSANLSFFQTISLAIARASGDVFTTLLNSSLQYASGNSLQLIATEFNITPVESAVSTGVVTVTDTSFQKVSTSIYAGANPVNVGSTVIYVGSITGFPSSGSVIIGRGTNDSEPAISYSSTAPIGNYFQINLTSATTRYHNVGESVILSQGGTRTIPVNTIVLSPSTGLVPSQQFSVTQAASILDGETTVTNVPVTALLPGSTGNVPIGAISQFASPPFSGAVVSNSTAPTSGGTDPSTDDQLRIQILNKLSSIGLGTATAIKNSLIGVSATDQAATIQSVSLVNNLNGSSTVYLSTGGSRPYEATTQGVAIEHIIDVSVGGEKFFQLATGGTQAPIAKAFLQSTDSSPFAISGGMVLAVTVGGITTEHTFLDSDFQAPGAATAYEICSSLNADSSLLFEATTAGAGTFVVIRAISQETHEGIQITTPASPTSVNANNFLGFPTTLNETLWLYKNKTLLSQDGNTASVLTQEQGLWSNSIAQGDTLILTVDNTAPITYTLENADFIATGLYATVNSTNSLASWVEVFNNKLTGVTASIVGTQIELTSNSGATTRAEISIDPSSTLVSKSMFSAAIGLSSNGSPADYILDRNTAQFQLATALVAGDNLTAGTENTKGTVTSAVIPGGTITFPTEGYIWLAIDEPVTIINTGAVSGSFISVSTTGSTVHYKSNSANSFSNVHPGDYVIVWSAQLAATNRLEGRVHSITTTSLTDDTLNILVTATEAAAVVPQTNIQIVAGFVVARMPDAPQKFNVPAGIQTLESTIAYLQTQTDSLTFGVSLEEYITVTTNTLNTSGSVTVVTLDTSGSQLNFTAGQTNASSYPLLAHQDTTEVYLPSFFHSTITSDTFASPPDTFLTTFTSNIDITSPDLDQIITFLNPYGGIDDEQPANEVVQETVAPAGAVVDFTVDPDVRRLRTNDRYFTSSPLSFGNNDSMVVVIDNNFTNYVFDIPFYRHALTNTTYTVDANSFNAYDSDFAPTGNFATSFGANFSFDNYKVLMQAKHILKSTTKQSSVLYRSVPWGTTGENIIVSYIYDGAAPAINNSVTITDTINITITVPSATTANAVVTYVNTLANGLTGYITATAVNDGTGGSPGTGIVTANNSTQLLDGVNWILATDLGPFSVITTANTNSNNMLTDVEPYTELQNGMTVAGPGIPNGTTIVNIVGNTVTMSNSVGTSTTGVGVTFTSTGSPQFTLKKPLAYPSDGTGYAFNNGETIILSPTTVEQVAEYTNILPVTGLTTASVVNTANRDSILEFSSDTFGSQGFVEVVGGPANGYAFPLQNGALNIGNQYAAITAVQTASSNVISDQWFFLQAATAQKKLTNFGVNSDVTIVPNSPLAGQSTVTVSGELATQLYFGAPRTIAGLSDLRFRVEKQGSLVCFSYVSSTGSPQFLTFPVNFNEAGSGTLSVSLVGGTNDSLYTILTGAATFSGLTIGDLVTISGLTSSGNNGTFMVSGVSATTLQVTNQNAAVEASDTYTTGTFSASTGVMEGDTVIVGSPFSPSNQGSYRVIRTWNDSFWITNPDYIEEEQTLTSSSLVFYPYEATVPGDQLVISGTAFGPNSAGTYTVLSVPSSDEIIVNGIISSVVALNLTGLLSSFYINEGVAYSGYKRVFLVAPQPGTVNLNEILFDTVAQYQKMNQSAGVEVNALQKMEFSTSVSQGIDGYKYNTGLIQQANRTVYGDPTSSDQYPGVSAAGSDIFIQEPLGLVVSVALEVRLATGAPFSSIQGQIQSNVAALIDGNPVGQSIAISSIIAVCTTIPGVVSVAISSPVYSESSDLITVSPSEQTFVLDPSTNISVSLIQ